MTDEAIDLGVKIGSPAEVLWTNALENCIRRISGLEDTLVIEKSFKEMCEQKIKVSK